MIQPHIAFFSLPPSLPPTLSLSLTGIPFPSPSLSFSLYLSLILSLCVTVNLCPLLLLSPSPPSPVYLLLGLIAMLVVLETFCELQQLKQLRKMFYLKKEKPQDRLAILEHDHLSFTSVSDHTTTSLREDKTEPYVDVPDLVSPGGDDPMLR